MDPLKQRFYEKASALAKEMKALLKEHGELKVDEVTLSQVYGGARSIKMMIWETSALDANEGIRFENAFCNNSICTPSRASIISGQYPQTNGVVDLHGILDTEKQYLPKEMKKRV